MIGALAFYFALAAAVLYILFLTFLFGRLKRVPARVRTSFAFITLGGIGLVGIAWVAITHPRNFDGKYLNALASVPANKSCVNVNVRFDKEKIVIFTKDKMLTLRDNYGLQPNSFKEMTLASKIIDDPKKVLAFDPAGNAYLELNLVDRECR